jgi:hypothetical protein
VLCAGRALRASWLLVAIWLWLSGEAHHGHPVTDAGWFRHGQRALTRIGHATRWWHLPRWQRAAHRRGLETALRRGPGRLVELPLVGERER